MHCALFAAVHTRNDNLLCSSSWSPSRRRSRRRRRRCGCCCCRLIVMHRSAQSTAAAYSNRDVLSSENINERIRYAAKGRVGSRMRGTSRFFFYEFKNSSFFFVSEHKYAWIADTCCRALPHGKSRKKWSQLKQTMFLCVCGGEKTKLGAATQQQPGRPTGWIVSDCRGQ